MVIRTIEQESVKSDYDLSNVLTILHSPSMLINLNPLVISHSLLPSTTTPTTTTTTTTTTSQYTITDSIPSFLPFLPSLSTTYTAEFELTENGTKTKTLAMMGIETLGEWSFEEGKVIERGSISAPWYLINFVEQQWREAHLKLLIRLEEKLNSV